MFIQQAKKFPVVHHLAHESISLDRALKRCKPVHTNKLFIL
jgi:hypothetical protein